jgi:polysaccharide biosynthesis protein PslE
LAQLVVAKLIDTYGELHGRINRSARAHEFLAQQSTNLKGELNGLENQIRVLKNTTGLAAPAEQRAILVTRIGRLEDDLKSTWTMIAATKAETGDLKTELSQISETQILTKADGLPNVAADGMRQQLYTLELKEKDLASRVTDQHVELRAVREQLAAARSVVDSLESSRTQLTRGPNRTYEELRLLKSREDALLASLGAKASAVEVQLASSKKELETLNNNETRIVQLDREVQIRDRSYRKYADSLEQARIDDSLEKERISNINIAQPPTLDRLPVRPRPSLALLLGLVVAVVGTVTIPLIAEYLDHTLKTSDEIESRLNLPVLVSIPRLRSNDPSHTQMFQ